MATNRILIVDDEETLCEVLKLNLENEGYDVDTAFSAEQALGYNLKEYSLILLDIMMGEISGIKMAKMLKADVETADIPIIFCTARDTEDDMVMGLNIGADDYIEKPYRPRELISRIKSVLRRAGKSQSILTLGNVSVDMDKGVVTKNGKDIFLSALEYRLFLVFLNNPGVTLTRNKLLSEIWDIAGDFVNDNTLTVYIKRLREKVEDDIQNPKIILTVRGLGYKLGEQK